MKALNAIFLISLLSLFMINTGCSSQGQNPVLSDTEIIEPVMEFPQSESSGGNHQLLGLYIAKFNADLLTTTVQSDRNTSLHWNVTTMIPAPIIQVNSWDPINEIIDVDIALHNPHFIDCYDVRLIIYTDTTGHELTNSDDWTTLFDIPQGLPINPFKAFAKQTPLRKFAGNSWQSENLKIKCPGGNLTVKFAIDASYPGNSIEPYEINVLTNETLYDQVGSSADIKLQVLDWQADVSSIELYCPQVTGVTLVPFTQIDPERWKIILTNNGASAGDYPGYIVAKSFTSGSLALYDRIAIQVRNQTSSTWIGTLGGTWNDYANAIDVDANGNIYVTGSFSGTTDFDLTSGSASYKANGWQDYFLCKYDTDQNLQWVDTWGRANSDMYEENCFAVKSDGNGNIYVAGEFGETTDFDPGTDIFQVTSNGNLDCFLSCFDTDGHFKWVRTWGSIEGSDQAGSISCGSDGNIFTCGRFVGTVDFDPGPGVIEGFAGSAFGAFIIEFSPVGDFIWAHPLEASSLCWKVAVSEDDNLFACGDFRGTIDFDPGPGEQILSSPLTDAAYLSKYDQSGNLCWVSGWGPDIHSDHQITAYFMSVDKSENVFITGEFPDTVDFDPGEGIAERTSEGGSDAYLLKLSSDGDFIWVNSWGGTGEYDIAFGTAIGSSGNILVTGAYSDVVDMDPGSGVDQFTSIGVSDCYITKFSSDGIHKWTHTIGGNNSVAGFDLKIDEADNLILAGFFSDTVDFDPGSDIKERTSNGDDDSFLLKLLPNGYLK